MTFFLLCLSTTYFSIDWENIETGGIASKSWGSFEVVGLSLKCFWSASPTESLKTCKKGDPLAQNGKSLWGSVNFEMCPKKKKSENHEAEEAEEEKKKQDGAGGKRTRVVSGGKEKGGRVTSRFLTSLKYKKNTQHQCHE